MTASPTNKVLATRLKAVWRRQQRLHQTGGLLAFCRWGLVVFLIGMVADWLLGLPVAGRVLILGALLGVALYMAWRAGWGQLRRFDASRAALQVEKHHGGLESLLVTAVQLAKPGSAAGASEAMREKTCRAAEETAASLHPEKTVSYSGLRRPALLALAPVLALAVFTIINGPFLAAGFGRIFTPWLAFEYPTKTQLMIEGGDRVVKEGESLRLFATLSGEVPDKATLVLRTGKGEPRERSLPVTDRTCEYSIEAVFRSFDYRISAGDAKSAWHSVRVISSPRIERAEVSLGFPEYTQRPAETVDALTLTVPEGTRIKWTLALDRAVSSAELRPAGDEVQPMQISPDGRSVTMERVAAGSRSYSFGWVDKEHQFAFSSPSHYLQVAPDQAPGVDLTSPDRNLYATLGRKIDLAYRCRDDHGIGEAAIAYRVNKTGEVKVPIPAPKLSDGSEVRVDWSYRDALPDLAVGDSLSLAIELADRYPGPQGPHRARSEGRRVQFLSKEDYLAQIEKEKRRLLAQVRGIYREERGVHDLIRNLNPAADIFLQTCQLEAVRQDLIRERLGAVRKGINTLVADMAANNITDDAGSAELIKLGNDLQAIADEHVGRAASLLRELAEVTGGEGHARNPAAAVNMVNSSARELGLVVLQLGFAEGADVMARELHATAQTQAGLRQRTVTGGAADADDDGELAKAQTRLAAETARLLAATPQNKESGSTDALVAFNLSRMVNQLLRAGTVEKMNEAAALIPKAEGEQAGRLQAGVIAALLRAEFRLRLGAEYEALTKARDLIVTQAAGQKKLREQNSALTKEQFSGNQAVIAASQAALHQQLQLLLMPEIPAKRPSLFDAVFPAAPPVDDLLAKAESGLKTALAGLKAGDREAAATSQQQAETAFVELAGVTGRRMESMTEQARMTAAVTTSTKLASQVLALEERLLAMLEQTEDAADDKVNAGFLADRNQAIVNDVELCLRNIVPDGETGITTRGDTLPLIDSVSRAARALNKATPLLKDNQPAEAIELQEQASDALKEAGAVIADLTETRTAFAGVLKTADAALASSPLLAEIESEQAILSASTEKTEAEPAGRAALVIPQKNLVHAVNAMLNSLDALNHRLDSGTVMLFAKEDMDAASVGLETGDIDEALDAQSAILDALREMRAKIDEITPRYRYVRELSEFVYEVMPASAAISTGIRQLREQAEGAPDADALKRKAGEFGSQLNKLTGEDRHAADADRLVQAIGDKGAEAALKESLDALRAEASDLQTLIKNLAYLIAPPVTPGYVTAPPPRIALLEKVLDLAAYQQDLGRNTQAAAQADLAAAATRQRKLADQCKALFPKPAAATAPVNQGNPAEAPEQAPNPDLATADEATTPEASPEPETAAEPPAPEQPAAEQPAAEPPAAEPPAAEPPAAEPPAPVPPAPAPHPKLAAAQIHMAAAAAGLEKGDRTAASTSQGQANDALRHFIIEYTLKYVMIPPPGPPQPGAPVDVDQLVEQDMPLFEPGALTGTKPKGGRGKWEVLGRRDRAALNENFARELPLEYRAILKDYYEKLTK